jgi:hypothetical protein
MPIVLQFIKMYKTQIIIGVAALLVLLYIVSLKMEISSLNNIISDYKVHMSEANAEIVRLSEVNLENEQTYELVKKDHLKAIELCEEDRVNMVTKENELLDLIKSLQNKKPEKIFQTEYILEECKVTVTESTDINESTLINRLNKSLGGF